MTALSIQPTFPIFTDIDGQPLEAGYIFIGVANLAPIGNPINVYWDAALTLPAVQPIRTIGGYPVNAGTPARLYVNSDYSIQVQNRNGSVVYSAPAATERLSGVVIEVDSTDVSFLQAGTGAVTRTAQAKMRDVVSVKDFGAVGDGVTDDTAAIQSALAASKSVFIPAGTYRVSSISVLYSGSDGYLVKGAGRNITKFVADGTVSNFFTVGSPVALTGYGNYSTFEDFTIDMTSMANSSSSRGLFLRDGYTHSFNRVTIIGVANTNKVPLYIGNRVYTGVPTAALQPVAAINPIAPATVYDAGTRELNLNMPEQIIHVAPPQVRVDAPVVNVPETVVNVNVPEQRTVVRTVERDADGRILHITERPEQ